VNNDGVVKKAKAKKLPRGIRHADDGSGRLMLYVTNPQGKGVRPLVTWDILKEYGVPVEANCKLLHPGLKLAQALLVAVKAEFQIEKRTGVAAASQKFRISDLYDLILADYAQQAFRSVRDVKHRWKNHLKPAFGDVLCAELTVDHQDRYIAQRQHAEAEAGTINRELSVIRRLFKLAHIAGKVPAIPPFRHLKETNIRQGFLLQAEYDRLAAHAQPIGIRGLLAVAYAYGFRRGECLDLRVRQVNLVNGTIELNRKQVKNDQAKVVVMTADVKNVLALCIVGKQPDDHAFTWAHGGAIRDFRETWKQLFAAAGVPLKLFHDLRRSAVRNMVNRGIDRDTAMRISGHRTASVFSRYNIVNLDNLRDAALKIAAGAQDETAQDETDTQTDSRPEGQPKADDTVQ
jgi:integrase